jgi:hypothetical protein
VREGAEDQLGVALAEDIVEEVDMLAK